MRVVDLFAGPGGWDVAANRLGVDPLGIEWDDAACATRRAAGFATTQADIAALDPRAEVGHADGLLASPPCQAFSTAGKRKGRDDLPNIRRCSIQLRHGRDHRGDHDWSDERAALVVEPLRWALALRPEWTAWEQVPPVLPYWELCAKLLESVGYWTWTGLLHAETFGVPQTRKRAFLIASRVGPVGPPAATHSRYYPRDKGRLDPGVEKWVSMAEALGLVDGRAYRPTTMPNATVRPAVAPAPTIAFGKDAASAAWVFERPATTVAGDPRISAPGWRGAPRDYAADGSYIGKRSMDEAIRLTVEEAAILQSFPADFPWQGSKTKQFEQVGNAIPPGLAQPVIEAAMAAGALELAA